MLNKTKIWFSFVCYEKNSYQTYAQYLHFLVIQF